MDLSTGQLIIALFCVGLIAVFALGGLVTALVYLRCRSLGLAVTWPLAVFLFLTRYRD